MFVHVHFNEGKFSTFQCEYLRHFAGPSFSSPCYVLCYFSVLHFQRRHHVYTDLNKKLSYATEIARVGGHCAVYGHPWSLISIPIEGP